MDASPDCCSNYVIAVTHTLENFSSTLLSVFLLKALNVLLMPEDFLDMQDGFGC